ncbi:Ohr subfamily peroxiredoxin [Paenibacillus phyllosphaerae]|uniref:Ohr subfamily peroxiredoxin n=1 Tax=Paenibacillus phyllosphaerae TaxID=274593 RepID=A0A7W5FPS6_9BACL|nr:organic hydroperoxide resistance protein [Paenibacillus phyllosphaerae]MBB3112543.1 Ohr subfamily peroxiredoxin [Paenibacillus phyllosphaerae]
MKTVYTAHVTSHGGRDGFVRSDDGQINLKLGMPMPGQTNGTNPEQLFAAGYSACFHSALKMIARSKGVDATESQVTAHVALNKDEHHTYRLGVVLEIAIPGLADEEVHQLAEAAHQMCPYSNATRGNIVVELKVVQAEPLQR